MTEIMNYSPAIFEDPTKTYDEDCLYLRVYTSNPTSSANMPVSSLLFMIYVLNDICS